ncbi:MAG: toprim domain-containing protein, partial [Steroidobacteraceae bacterium]
PKYLNSPETALFHKGRELYGLYEARRSRAASSRLLVVEGYLDVVRLHQFSVSYAVATLGTATTAEHLKRLFQLAPEVIFAFDGDRAGRAAAWRALEHSLPEAHEGREIRFLFLPEGEDPDTLVAKEGREAFEARIEKALPLSEYVVRELGERISGRGADGRARVAQAIRPLLERVPEGIYRRLLVERLAEAFGFQRTPEGITDLLGVTIGGRPPAAGTRMLGPGRGGLVRQAIRLLLQFPQVATALPPGCVPAGDASGEPGSELLQALIAELQERPAANTGQILERWRDRPEAEHFARLAAGETLVPDAGAAQLELTHALKKLAEQARRRRLDSLLERDREGALSSDERQEIQRLTMWLARGRSLAATP